MSNLKTSKSGRKIFSNNLTESEIIEDSKFWQKNYGSLFLIIY